MRNDIHFFGNLKKNTFFFYKFLKIFSICKNKITIGFMFRGWMMFGEMFVMPWVHSIRFIYLRAVPLQIHSSSILFSDIWEVRHLPLTYTNLPPIKPLLFFFYPSETGYRVHLRKFANHTRCIFGIASLLHLFVSILCILFKVSVFFKIIVVIY